MGRWRLGRQVWLQLDVLDIGYGHSADQVALVSAGADCSSGYHDAVFESTAAYVMSLSAMTSTG